MNSIPFQTFPFLYISGLMLSLDVNNESSADLFISPGQCRDSTDTFQIKSDSIITVNAYVSGANGLDEGTFTGLEEMFAVYMIYDPANERVAGLLSRSKISPLLPSGYSVSRLIGWAPMVNASYAFDRGWWSGSNASRMFTYINKRAMASNATIDYHPIFLYTCVPPVDNQLIYVYSDFYIGAYATDRLFIKPYYVQNDQVIISTPTANNALLSQLDENGYPAILYKVTDESDSCEIYLTAFTYDV
jgi:hypothetical protein